MINKCLSNMCALHWVWVLTDFGWERCRTLSKGNTILQYIIFGRHAKGIKGRIWALSVKEFKDEYYLELLTSSLPNNFRQ